MNTWQVAQYLTDIPDGAQDLVLDDLDWISAKVPGAVQYDLMAAGRLKNPYASTKAAFGAAWVAKSDWLYHTSFEVEDVSRKGRWILYVDGIDTYAEVWLGGTMIAEVSNNYRSYEFEISPKLLKNGANDLYIRVKAHDRMMRGVEEAKKRLGRDDGVEGTLGKALIRRYQRSFFTNSSLLNLGTGILGIGINRPVKLRFCPEVRIIDCFFRTLEITENKAKGEIHVETDGEAQLSFLINDTEGNSVFETSQQIKGKAIITVNIDNPKLWWPAGYGDAYLYNLTVKTKDMSIKKSIGIRCISIEQKTPEGLNNFRFVVNGKPIYVRGQNFIPLDYIKVYAEESEYTNFFRLLENANTNLVRVWGGGMPESESFYSKCDSLGLMVWQDCFLHSNVYPDYDPSFVSDFLSESEELIHKIRRHPCFVVLCGGNEQLEGWEEWGWNVDLDSFYGRLLLDKLHELAKIHCPDIPYVDNSPHGGRYAQSPTEGDSHNWGSYFNCFKDPLFVTETCWSQESYSRPETLKKYMGINVDEFAGKGWFEKFSTLTSLGRQNRLPYSNWFNVQDLRSYLLALDLEQARADYSALSVFRLRSPSNTGIVYWSFNKGGPLFQFGCVDYGGYPLMSYYVVRRLYEKCVVGVYRDVEDICLIVSNESGGRFEGTAELLHIHSDGSIIAHHKTAVIMEDNTRKKVILSEAAYKNVTDRTKELFFARLKDEKGNTISEDILFLCPYSEFHQAEDAVPVVDISRDGDAYVVSLECSKPIQLIALESNQKIICTDNYFPAVPGEKKIVRIHILEVTSDEAPILRVLSHYDARVSCCSTIFLDML